MYFAPPAYAGTHGLAGIHPGNGKLFAVLLGADTAIPLAEGVTLSNLTDADALWSPTGSQRDAEGVDGTLRLAAGASFPVSVIGDAAGLGPGSAIAFARPDGLTPNRSTAELPDSELLDSALESGGEGGFGSGSAKVRITPGACEGEERQT